MLSHRQAVGCGTEHHCHSLMPKELHPRRCSRLQRSVNKYLQSLLTVPRERRRICRPQQALKPASPRAGSQRHRPGSPLTFARLHLSWSGLASLVYRSCEIGQSFIIDFVPLPATAAPDNSHHMDFSLNPQINICSGRNILLLDVAKPPGPTGLGIEECMAYGCPSQAWVHNLTSAL